MNPLASDLDYVLYQTLPLWESLRGRKLFLTGGTGFVGSWILESFLWANERLDLRARATVLTRDPDAFHKKSPHLAGNSSVVLLHGDVRSFSFLGDVAFACHQPFIIHAATDSSTVQNKQDPLVVLDVICNGTRHVLDYAQHADAPALLFISSKAAELTYDPESAYGNGKRVAELLCKTYHKDLRVNAKILRLWAMIGPYLPLDAHFAAGNFIRDVLEDRPIAITGDGGTIRSWLYAADMVVAVWKALLEGEPGIIHTAYGSETMTIRDLAHRISYITHIPVRESPSDIDSAIRRTLQFHGRTI